MKKIFETIIGLVCIFAIFLASAENADGSCNVVWTFSCIAVAVVCGVIWGKLQPKPIHITDGVYFDLQGQIEEAVDDIDEDGIHTIEVETWLPDELTISVTIEFVVKSSRSSFTDGAWGNTKTFTEVKRECKGRITDVRVFDRADNEHRSDFDEDLLELELKATQWS